MSMQWEILMVGSHEIRAVNKCLQKRARPERTGCCSTSCSLCIYIYKLYTEETVFKTQEQLNSIESFEATVCGSCRLYNLVEVNMKTKPTVSSLKLIKLRLPGSTGKQLSAPWFERDGKPLFHVIKKCGPSSTRKVLSSGSIPDLCYNSGKIKI